MLNFGIQTEEVFKNQRSLAFAIFKHDITVLIQTWLNCSHCKIPLKYRSDNKCELGLLFSSN